MQSRIPLLFTLLFTTLTTACSSPVQPMSGLRSSQLQSFSQRPAVQSPVNQLVWALDMPDYRPATDPGRVLRVEYKTVQGQAMEIYIQYLVNSASAHVRVGPVAAPSAAGSAAQYFDSTDQVRLKALVQTLKSMGITSADAKSKQHLAIVINYLEKAVKP